MEQLGTNTQARALRPASAGHTHAPSPSCWLHQPRQECHTSQAPSSNAHAMEQPGTDRYKRGAVVLHPQSSHTHTHLPPRCITPRTNAHTARELSSNTKGGRSSCYTAVPQLQARREERAVGHPRGTRQRSLAASAMSAAQPPPAGVLRQDVWQAHQAASLLGASAAACTPSRSLVTCRNCTARKQHQSTEPRQTPRSIHTSSQSHVKEVHPDWQHRPRRP